MPPPPSSTPRLVPVTITTERESDGVRPPQSAVAETIEIEVCGVYRVRVWLAVGRTDMRRGMNGLALQVQEALKRDPHAGDLFVFHGRRADLVKILWHEGLGLSLYAKRLDRGRFVWPLEIGEAIAISPA